MFYADLERSRLGVSRSLQESGRSRHCTSCNENTSALTKKRSGRDRSLLLPELPACRLWVAKRQLPRGSTRARDGNSAGLR